VFAGASSVREFEYFYFKQLNIFFSEALAFPHRNASVAALSPTTGHP
jgi:hypothetical protein